MAIVTPIIHLNGDRKETLLAQLETVWSALLTVEKALAQCGPNARNYYPEPGRMEQAVAQHHARQAHVRALCDSILAEVHQIEKETQ